MARKSKSQSRLKRNRREKQQRERRKLAARQRSPAARSMLHAENLVARRRWDEARDLLEEMAREKPVRPEVLRRLLDVYHELGDHAASCRTCRRLLKIVPDDAELHLQYAGALLQDGRVASALSTILAFLERWPDHEFAEGARADLARFESALEELAAETPFPPDDRLHLMVQHEEVIASMKDGDFSRSIQVGEALHRQSPEFVPVMNNLTEAYFRVGQPEKALAMSRRVLQLEPENLHALGNLARHLLLVGRRDEAESFADRLRRLDPGVLDDYAKQAETFSYWGDDQAVLDVLARADRAGCLQEKTFQVGLLYHLAGVAAARQGEIQTAKAHWRKALRAAPSLDLVRENLDDLKRRVGQRHGPFPFAFENWVSRELIGDLLQPFQSAGRAPRRASEPDRVLTQALKRHPELSHMVPLLLDRGDPVGREFAIRLAKFLQTPPMLDALRSYCLSTRGPDESRIETANFLAAHDALPSGQVRLWIDGQWTETELFGMEITDEPTGLEHSPQVERWLEDALDALRAGDGSRAETLLLKALGKEPDSPDLLNNLAAAYELQGRGEDAWDLIERVHERWPDYFFGCIAMAKRALAAGDLDKAQEALAGLMKRKKFHTTEFVALCEAHVRLYSAREDFEGVERWVETWKSVKPDDPLLKKIEPRLALMRLVDRARHLGRRRR